MASNDVLKDIFTSLSLSEVNSGVFTNKWEVFDGKKIQSINPANNELLAEVVLATKEHYSNVRNTAISAFAKWRKIPAPKRGDIVRQIADELRIAKEPLGKLVSLEMGKILTEGLGEVQEMIDIADFAVGLSRQLYGKTMHSERPLHRMYEQWHPLGVVGVITAFNFPVAVWAWNALIAAVCGDSVIWKPSLKTPLTAIATQNIINKVMKAHDLEGVFTLIIGHDEDCSIPLVEDRNIPLISATGSCKMGRAVGQAVSLRLGKTLLELGGNNAVIVLDDADIDLATRAIVFGAVGTAGQRCTTTRRVYMQKGISENLTKRLVTAYKSVKIGDPLDESTLMGPLIDEIAVKQYESAIELALKEGAIVLTGGKRLDGKGFFVEPTIIKANKNLEIAREETFAPILYLFEVDDLESAIEENNSVSQGLSSSLFTSNILSSEKFLSFAGSDCGIANINIGTSGAEIGGAFGGEKDTGGGREAGSDSWKAYMRRQTNTINWSKSLPLAQGLKFDID